MQRASLPLADLACVAGCATEPVVFEEISQRNAASEELALFFATADGVDATKTDAAAACFIDALSNDEVAAFLTADDPRRVAAPVAKRADVVTCVEASEA